MTPELLLNSKAAKMGFVLQMTCRHWHLHPHIKLETKHPETFCSKYLIFLYWYCTFCFGSLSPSWTVDPQFSRCPVSCRRSCRIERIIPNGIKEGYACCWIWVIAVPSGLCTWEAWGRNMWSGEILPWAYIHEPLLIQSNPIPMAGQPLALFSETIYGCSAQTGTIMLNGF